MCKKRNAKPIELNFNEFFSVPHGFMTPPRIAPWPKGYKEIKDALDSAIHMASQIELVDEGASTSNSDKVRPAYFRASLTELSRIDDIAKSAGKPRLFLDSTDPSLHAVKLLRNYQIHIAAMPLSSGQVSVRHSGEEFVYRSFIADNILVENLKKLDSASPYTEDQLNELVSLFNERQKKFGVVQLLYHLAKHIEAYARRSLSSSKRSPDGMK